MSSAIAKERQAKIAKMLLFNIVRSSASAVVVLLLSSALHFGELRMVANNLTMGLQRSNSSKFSAPLPSTRLLEGDPDIENGVLQLEIMIELELMRHFALGLR